MSLWKIIKKEIMYYKDNFIMGLLSVIIAVTVFVGALTMLGSHDIRTEELIGVHEARIEAELDQLQDEMRLISRDMGYNIMILHEDQDLADLRRKGYPEHYLPVEYAYDLAQSGEVPSLNHILPVLQEEMYWSEKDMEIIVAGIDKQIPNVAQARHLTDDLAAYLDPMTAPISTGELQVGYEIANSLDLAVGDTLLLNNEEFIVDRIHQRKNNADDLMVWIHRKYLEDWFGLEGKINAIMALQCMCALPRWRGSSWRGETSLEWDPDTLQEMEYLTEIDEQIEGVLADIQVLETGSIIVARARARISAAQTHYVTMQSQIEFRNLQREERETLIKILIPLVFLAAAIWIFFLIIGNVKQRQGEIGIMRAVGVGQNKIMSIFLIKAGFMGLLGGLIGYFLGLVAGAMIGDISIWSQIGNLFNPILLLMVVVFAPLIAVIAGWIPANNASQIDPAMILREE